MKRQIKSHVRKPLKLNLSWEDMPFSRRKQAEALGFTQESWRSNQEETLDNLWLNEMDEFSINGHDMPHRRVKLMVGDPARERLTSPNTFCITQLVRLSRICS